MKRHELKKLAKELDAILDAMVEGLGRTESREAMKLYALGLLLDGERKSVEPIAARLVHDEAETEAMRQRLQQAVTVSPWADEVVLERLALKVDRELPGVEALVIDDTGFPKKGTHSVGVTRQYSGTLGRVDNCQVAASLHLASEAGSGCIGMQMYLTEAWASDAARRKKAGVPETVGFERKWEIALGLLDRALGWGVRKHLVLADAGSATAASSVLRSRTGASSTSSASRARSPSSTASRARPRSRWATSPRVSAAGRSAVSRGTRDRRDRSRRASRSDACVPLTARAAAPPRARSSGCSASGRPTRRGLRNSGSPTCHREPSRTDLSVAPSSAGAWNVTTRR
jgi:SRSO17 transposase